MTLMSPIILYARNRCVNLTVGLNPLDDIDVSDQLVGKKQVGESDCWAQSSR